MKKLEEEMRPRSIEEQDVMWCLEEECDKKVAREVEARPGAKARAKGTEQKENTKAEEENSGKRISKDDEGAMIREETRKGKDHEGKEGRNETVKKKRDREQQKGIGTRQEQSRALCA